MKTLNELMEMAKKANGRNRARIIGKEEAEMLLQAIESVDDSAHTIRVYSQEGFVANSYKYRANISYFEARREESGNWNIIATTTDAKRSYGSGSLVTVNGRAV